MSKCQTKWHFLKKNNTFQASQGSGLHFLTNQNQHVLVNYFCTALTYLSLYFF